MALGDGPKQYGACWMISTPLLEDFVQFYLGTWLHKRGVYPSHMEGEAESWSSLAQMYFGKRRANRINLFWSR